MTDPAIGPLSDSPTVGLHGTRWEMVDGRLTCVEVMLYRPEGITTAFVRSLPIATLIEQHRPMAVEVMRVRPTDG